MNWVNEYWESIQAGRCIVSNRVRKIYARLVSDIEYQTGGFVFDEGRADKPIAFIEQFCKHSKGEWAGQPVKLELFQKAYIAALFGFINKDTGLRKYKETLFMVARKNGKSTMLAALALYMMIADGEPGSEVYSVATKKDQARIIFSETHNMTMQSPELNRYVKKRKTDLYFATSMSKFQPLGKNSDTLDGLNAHCVIIRGMLSRGENKKMTAHRIFDSDGRSSYRYSFFNFLALFSFKIPLRWARMIQMWIL